MLLIYLSSTGAYRHAEGAVELQSTNRGQALNSIQKNTNKSNAILESDGRNNGYMTLCLLTQFFE